MEKLGKILSENSSGTCTSWKHIAIKNIFIDTKIDGVHQAQNGFIPSFVQQMNA